VLPVPVFPEPELTGAVFPDPLKARQPVRQNAMVATIVKFMNVFKNARCISFSRERSIQEPLQL
jgi:hypothetical protein